jgi:hypothetical protein
MSVARAAGAGGDANLFLDFPCLVYVPQDREGVPFEAWLAHGRRAGGRRRRCQSFFRFLYLVYLKMPNIPDNAHN